MSKQDLYAKWPALKDIELPEHSTCCWGCATQYVADVAGWPAANDWMDAMWGRFLSPQDFRA